MRRIGSNIRKQNSDAKANRITKNIIQYADDLEPRNDYPKKIVSPSRPSSCCNDDQPHDGGQRLARSKASSSVTRSATKCGHAVKFYFPSVESTSTAVKEYRQWKRYLVQ